MSEPLKPRPARPDDAPRACGFHECHGWRPAGDEQFSTELGLPVLEHRADLS